MATWPFRLLSLVKAHMVLMRICGELGRMARFPKCPGFLIHSGLSVVVLCFQTSSFLWQNRSSCMMRLQGLVVSARHLSSDRGLMFGSDGLPLVRVVFFPSSSLMGVVLFPSYAHCWNCARERLQRGRCVSKGQLLSLALSIIPPSHLFSFSFSFFLFFFFYVKKDWIL